MHVHRAILIVCTACMLAASPVLLSVRTGFASSAEKTSPEGRRPRIISDSLTTPVVFRDSRQNLRELHPMRLSPAVALRRSNLPSERFGLSARIEEWLPPLGEEPSRLSLYCRWVL
ncbi:MAG: hypothetical protein JXA11_16595 [Phycisphaerae bacterium]|nr:hypothetical protein [Phycisphaerae bacterium]